jgi:hypothetical protein
VTCAVLLLAVDGRPQGTATDSASAASASHAPQPGLALELPPVFEWKQKKLGKGRTVAVAVDSEDRAHVVYRREGKKHALVHAWRDGSKWSSETIWESTSNIVVGAALAIDAQDVLHVAYSTIATIGGAPPYHSLSYARRDAGGWASLPVDNQGDGAAPSIAVDTDGTVHMLAIKTLGGASLGLRHLQQTPTGWDVEVIVPGDLGDGRTALLMRDGGVYALFSDAENQLSLGTVHAGVWSFEPIDTGHRVSAAFGQDGLLHVVYDGGPDLETRHAWRDELGWEHETLVSAAGYFGTSPWFLTFVGESPAIAADAEGRLQVACGLRISGGTVLSELLAFSTHENDAWSEPVLLGGGPIGYENALAADSRGLLTIATLRGLNLTDRRVTALSLRGSKLSLAVTPKGSGTVTVAPTGTTCTTKSTEYVYPGTEVTLTAEPAPGFSFDGWKGGAAGSELDVVLAMNQDKKVTAHFAPAP